MDNNDNKETQSAVATKKRGLVGIRFNDAAIIAWNLADNKNIRVTARKVNGNCWQVSGYVADTLRIAATVFGGKHATLRYVLYIRNGLTSRVMRRKHAKAAEPLSPEEELAATVARQKGEA